ncbi:unnamed protein product [Eruca vesicaria subsp. sativa]|uniref:Rubisco accumulation factor 1, chloroplastic n=1 Tax=Eruca vesicaria subsp. sativa TaxID=29727 RepID=A0ABC8IU27_ERUVS|nr:unnamed protein product [Eruca vesicaria subsp. sativa]
MLSLTATTLKPSILTKPKPNHPSPHPTTRPTTIKSNLIPASNRHAPPKQNLYQPFRPPPSPIPPKFRSLDPAGKIQVLADRLGLWFEYAPLISSLYTQGFTPPTIEELTGISGVEQNCLIVGAQVRDSIAQSNPPKPDLIAAFDTGGAELLYEIRLLSTVQRVAAAEYIVDHGFDTKGAQDLARAIKDYPHRRGDVGWEEFDYNLPGDCLSFMLYRKSREHKSSSELRNSLLEKALEVAVTEKAKRAVSRELNGESNEEERGEVNKIIRVPVVRLKFGEVAGASSVVVVPVCRGEEGVERVKEAPMEFEGGGEFGVVEAEKEWSRWVVLPGWDPVVAVRRGGVAVSFGDDREVLPWNGKGEGIMVVMDREKRKVEDDDGYYLVVSESGMKLERGLVLKERGVEECLGLVVLVVRPPRDDDDDWQINDEDWD